LFAQAQGGTTAQHISYLKNKENFVILIENIFAQLYSIFLRDIKSATAPTFIAAVRVTKL
jgi:hypothetical protein